MKPFFNMKASFLLTMLVLQTSFSIHQTHAQESTPIPLIPLTLPPVESAPAETIPATTDALAPVQEATSSTATLSVPTAATDVAPAAVPSTTDALQIPQVPSPAAQDAQPAVAVDTNEAPQDPPAPSPQAVSELPPVNADEMVDEDRDDLLRGPVHEAYAEQLNVDPVPGMVVSQKPPEPVEEVPPDLKPDGRQVEWISGYWAWDEDQDDFIWISGIWREVPQGFRWLPGYWTEVDGGYQWVSGTWVSTKTEEITYLNDAPPETLEQGPVGDAPTAEHIWIPGTWMWNDTRYAWRPGYWSGGYTNWIWVPARYQWTPRGYYFCDGYWDYPVQRRGVLFAPSYFNRRFHNRRISRFTPRVVVASNLLTMHFWVRPRYRHYYFGNYYNIGWANRGLTPWHQYPRQRRHFDPLYAYYGRGHRSNDFYDQMNNQFNVFVNQPNRRPAITFRDQDRWAREHRDDFRPNDFLGNRFQNIVENSSHDRSGFQFVRLENQQREQVQQETRRLHDLVNQRRDVERDPAFAQRRRDHAGDHGAGVSVLDGQRGGKSLPDLTNGGQGSRGLDEGDRGNSGRDNPRDRKRDDAANDNVGTNDDPKTRNADNPQSNRGDSPALADGDTTKKGERRRDRSNTDSSDTPTAGKTDAAAVDNSKGSVDRHTNHASHRDRLKLPPAASTNDAIGTNSGTANNTGGANSNPNSGDADRNARVNLRRTKVETNANATAGRPDEKPAVDRPPIRRAQDRSQNNPASNENVTGNGSQDSPNRSHIRSRGSNEAQTNSPANVPNASSEDKSPRMRNDANSSREPVKEPVVRNHANLRDRASTGGLNSNPQPGNERSARRETAPKMDSPPPAASRIRSSEPRVNTRNSDGNAGGNARMSGEGGAARESRRSPPSGGDRGDSNAGRTHNAGRGDSGAGGGGHRGAAGGGGHRGREK